MVNLDDAAVTQVEFILHDLTDIFRSVCGNVSHRQQQQFFQNYTNLDDHTGQAADTLGFNHLQYTVRVYKMLKYMGVARVRSDNGPRSLNWSCKLHSIKIGKRRFRFLCVFQCLSILFGFYCIFDIPFSRPFYYQEG